MDIIYFKIEFHKRVSSSLQELLEKKNDFIHHLNVWHD